MTYCESRSNGIRCDRPAGHGGYHRGHIDNRLFTWGETRPVWVQRAMAHALVAKDMTGGAA